MALLRGLLLLIVAIYAFAFIIAVCCSERIMFQPQRSGYRDDGSVIKLSSTDRARISAIYLNNPTALFTILFSHGNAEDIGDIAPLLDAIRSAGFSVFAYDYQGYGTSEGKPSEVHAYGDEDAAFEYLVQQLRIPPDRIIAFGRSIGSGPATDLASRRPLAGLVLESAFTSAFRVMTRIRLLPFDRFNNLSKIKNVRCPVLIMHGLQDTVVSPSFGRELFAAANQPKQFLWVENAHHNDLAYFGGKRYLDALKMFRESIEHGQRLVR